MSLQDAKMAIWQLRTERSGLGAQPSHLCSLSIPARRTGIAEVTRGGSQKAKEMLSVQKDLPEPWPLFHGLSKPLWLGVFS